MFYVSFLYKSEKLKKIVVPIILLKFLFLSHFEIRHQKDWCDSSKLIYNKYHLRQDVLGT